MMLVDYIQDDILNGAECTYMHGGKLQQYAYYIAIVWPLTTSYYQFPFLPLLGSPSPTNIMTQQMFQCL